MKVQWNKVTWYSKLIAVILFMIVFWFGLWLGMQYQHASDQLQNIENTLAP
jgi:hypothetical protein